MLVAVKLSVWLAADESKDSAQSKDLVPPVCLRCNWIALSLPDKTKALCCPLIIILRHSKLLPTGWSFLS